MIMMTLLFTMLPSLGCISIMTSGASERENPHSAAPVSSRRVQVHPYGDSIDPVIWTERNTRSQAVALDSQTYVRLAEKVNQAVVSIFTTQKYEAGIGDPLGLFRIPFKDLYARSLGSGFIIHRDGFIITNAHVVAEADQISVLMMTDEQVKTARVVGLDTLADLAILKIETDRPLPVLPMADSDEIKVGEVAVAIGNPYGLQHSLTIGVISATGRRISKSSIRGGLEDYLQTSAQINPGNSGGPLLNLQGEVIGVNTAVYAQAQGIGFAIPSNLVKKQIPILVREGRVKRSFVGLLFTGGFSPYPEDLGQGVIVYGVYRHSPASYAGIQRGDRILSIDGKRIADPFEASRMIADLPIGSRVTVEISRGGISSRISMTTIELGG